MEAWDTYSAVVYNFHFWVEYQWMTASYLFSNNTFFYQDVIEKLKLLQNIC